jgi:hypothetical protein
MSADTNFLNGQRKERRKKMAKASKDLDGRQVSSLYFDTGETRSYSGVFTAFYHYGFHGEWDDAWIVVYKNNVEIQRWNTHYIKGIEWVWR